MILVIPSVALPLTTIHLLLRASIIHFGEQKSAAMEYAIDSEALHFFRYNRVLLLELLIT